MISVVVFGSLATVGLWVRRRRRGTVGIRLGFFWLEAKSVRTDADVSHRYSGAQSEAFSTHVYWVEAQMVDRCYGRNATIEVVSR